MIPSFDWLAQRPKCFSVFKNYVAENTEPFQDTPDLAEDFDSPICLAYTMAKKLQCLREFNGYTLYGIKFDVQPSKHLVLINGYTLQGQWYEGDSHLSFSNPYALAECWRHYFNNQILDVTQNLWKDYHFMGSIKRIFVFGPRPYANAISHIRIVDHYNPRSFLTSGKTPEFEPLLYCGFCNQHTTYHEHACNDDPL